MKKILCLLLALTCLLLCAGPAALAAPDKIRVFLDGEEILFDVDPFIENGRTLVPVRAIAEALGCLVDWYPESNMAVISPGRRAGATLAMALGSDMAYVGDELVALDVPPRLVGGRTFVPLRFLGESLGLEVEWDGNARFVLLSDPVRIPLLEGKTASEAFPLLNGRFLVNMPVGTQNTSFADAGDGEADSSADNETQLFLFERSQTLMLYATSLLRTSTGDLREDARLAQLDETYRYADVKTVGGGLSYLIFTPQTPAPAAQILLGGALLRFADNTLAIAAVSIDANAYTHLESCVNMTAAILNSIRVGSYTPNTDARTVSFYDCSIRLEKDYVYYRESSADYSVIYVQKIVPIGQEAPGFGIYSGFAPTFNTGELPETNLTDTLLGQSVKWHGNLADGAAIDATTRFEVLVGPLADDSYKHGFVQPRSARDWSTIRQMFRSIKLLPSAA
ncbi:MAG: copper amine oxidase N-terminal domain-containing protein [Oscillospiraceae bacterium]|jgi:hypothetical protein|nr:copper amine oxidase N-terminal domain-containing protein [Oscillospiraceae bacterium]